MVTVLLCIWLVDRPVERIVAAHQNLKPLFQLCASPSLLPLPLACAYLLLAAWRKLAGAAFGSPLGLRLSLAIFAATAAKDELKWVFGRAWPETWLKYGIYGFSPFANDWLHGGFPSGHTAYITAPLCILWWRVPQFRWLWAALALLVMVGLVGAEYHFVGDVVAGFFTGLVAAAATLVLMDAHLDG